MTLDAIVRVLIASALVNKECGHNPRGETLYSISYWNSEMTQSENSEKKM